MDNVIPSFLCGNGDLKKSVLNAQNHCEHFIFPIGKHQQLSLLKNTPANNLEHNGLGLGIGSMRSSIGLTIEFPPNFPPITGFPAPSCIIN